MQISTIQGQTLVDVISVEAALLELLEKGVAKITPETTAQISTVYTDTEFTASLSLPIRQQVNLDGTVNIIALNESIPTN